MIIYCIFIGLFYSLSFVRLSHKKTVLRIMALSLALLSGLRYQTGTDYMNFIRVFRDFQNGRPVYTEPGYNAYMYLISVLFGVNALIFYLAQSLLTMLSFEYSIKRNVGRDYWICMMALFITTSIFFQTMNTSRQYVATAFTLFAFEYGKRKEWIRFFLLSFLALSFHASIIVLVAFFFALCFWVDEKKVHTRAMAVINVFVIASLILGRIDIRASFLTIGKVMEVIPFLARFTGYFQSYYFIERKTDSWIKFIVPNFMWFYIYFNYRKIKRQQKKNAYIDYYIIMFAAYLFIENCFSGVNVLVRIAMQVEISLLYVIPICIQSVHRRNRIFMKLFFLSYFLALTVYSIFLRGGTGAVPYSFILFHPEGIYIR